MTKAETKMPCFQFVFFFVWWINLLRYPRYAMSSKRKPPFRMPQVEPASMNKRYQKAQVQNGFATCLILAIDLSPMKNQALIETLNHKMAGQPLKHHLLNHQADLKPESKPVLGYLKDWANILTKVPTPLIVGMFSRSYSLVGAIHWKPVRFP